MEKYYIIALLLLTIAEQIRGEFRAKVYLTPDQCAQSEYFDALSLTCVPCSTQAEVNYSIGPNQTDVLVSSALDKTVCLCRQGLLPDIFDGKFRCVQPTCGAGQVFLAGECGVCSSESSNCTCTNDQVLRRVLLEDQAGNQSIPHFRCVPLRASLGLTQLPCHSSYLQASGRVCTCPESSHLQEDGQCLPQRSLISGDTRLKYASIGFRKDRFLSQQLYSTLRPAIYNCNHLKNQSACHLLLNLCVLKLATELSSVGSGEDKWNLCLYLNHLNPKLDFQFDPFYVSDHLENVLKDRFHANDLIQLISLTFNSKGHFIRMDRLDLSTLFLCNDARLRHRDIRFGTNLFKRCTWQVGEFAQMAFQQKSSYFYELYLHSSGSQLYPIPVKMSFAQELSSRWMARRFFLVNTQIGVDLVQFNEPGTNRFILYAKSVGLQFQVSNFASDGRIYPPTLSIVYDAFEPGGTLSANLSVETEFSLTFQMSDSSITYSLNMVVSILCSFTVLWSIFRTWCWTKRSANGSLDLSIVSTFVAKTIAYFSNVLLVTSLVFVITQLIVFKFQSAIHTVLLTPEQESTIIVYLVVAYVLKLIQLFKVILTVTSVDIFFLDWEKPRKKETLESYGKMDDKMRERISSIDKRTEIEQTNLRGQSALSHMSTADAFPNITIWRSYFVANEWRELSCKRRIEISSHIFMLLLILECPTWGSLTKATPHANSNEPYLDEVAHSITGRVAFASFFYIALAATQFLYRKYLSENLGCGKLNEFIDLCSVSNISVFCLKYKKYGFYVHGHSPSGRSDVNMLEMYELLEMEESDLCSKRGLLPNTEQQTFEMYLPASVYEQWNILRKSFDRARPSPRLSRANAKLGEQDKGKLVHAYFAINHFLCSFIEHTFAKADYIVQDRSGIESFMDFELGSVHHKGRLYNDNGHSFENILFYGIELTVATFELLTFLMIDLMVRNFMLAAIGTYLASKLIGHVYGKMSRKNLVLKTLMDERFLI